MNTPIIHGHSRNTHAQQDTPASVFTLSQNTGKLVETNIDAFLNFPKYSYFTLLSPTVKQVKVNKKQPKTISVYSVQHVTFSKKRYTKYMVFKVLRYFSEF